MPRIQENPNRNEEDQNTRKETNAREMQRMLDRMSARLRDCEEFMLRENIVGLNRVYGMQKELAALRQEVSLLMPFSLPD
jgi:hypothetical protein